MLLEDSDSKTNDKPQNELVKLNNFDIVHEDRILSFKADIKNKKKRKKRKEIPTCLEQHILR